MARGHPGSIDKHGDRWRVRLSFNGKRYAWTLDAEEHSKEDAEELASSKLKELKAEQKREDNNLPARVRFSEMLHLYRRDTLPTLSTNSQKSYETTLKAAETFFVGRRGDPMAHKVSRGLVSRFLKWRRTHAPDGSPYDSPVSARTVDKDRVVLGVVFSDAEEDRLIDRNPAHEVSPRKGDSREAVYLNNDQYEALVTACEDRSMLYPYVLVLGECGLRCDSEALWLRWHDIDLQSGLLSVVGHIEGDDGDVRRTKNGRGRKVPMSWRLRKALSEHASTFRKRTYRGKTSRWVFHHELDRRHAKAGTRLKSLRRAFKSAVERAGLPEAPRQHDLRHRRVKEWLDEGHPVQIVQQAMGHSDVKITMGYYKHTENQLKRLIDAPPETEVLALTGTG